MSAAQSDHIATGPSYSATTRKRVGTSYFYTIEDVDHHVRACEGHGLAPGVRWRKGAPGQGERDAPCGFCGHPRRVHSMDQPNAACTHWEPARAALAKADPTEKNDGR